MLSFNQARTTIVARCLSVPPADIGYAGPRFSSSDEYASWCLAGAAGVSLDLAIAEAGIPELAFKMHRKVHDDIRWAIEGKGIHWVNQGIPIPRGVERPLPIQTAPTIMNWDFEGQAAATTPPRYWLRPSPMLDPRFIRASDEERQASVEGDEIRVYGEVLRIEGDTSPDGTRVQVDRYARYVDRLPGLHLVRSA